MFLSACLAVAAAFAGGSVAVCDSCGDAVYYVENRDGGGFEVRFAGESEPAAISESGTFDPSAESPLRALLELHAERRRAAGASAAGAPSAARPLAAAVAAKSLKYAGASAATLDVRVGPMIRSQWQQKHLTYPSEPAFNYYTPGNAACGCVALAFSQIMHGWKWPRRYNGTPSPIRNWVGDETVWLAPIGGEYDWDAMPLGADDCKTLYQRQCCGHIAYDVAVCFGTRFVSETSGSWADLAPDILKKHFSYANARSFDHADSYMTGGKPLNTLDDYRNAILASLDGGMSAVVGARSETTGGAHEFVVDGYAIAPSGRIYCHVNFGWGGLENAWYDLVGGETTVSDTYRLNVLDDVIYNIHPTRTGEVVSGRVLDGSGAPLAGVAVSLLDKSKKTVDSTTTSANGIYALRFSGKGTFTVKAEASGKSAARTVTIDKAAENVEGRVNEYAQPIIVYDRKTGASGVVANRWGIDLALDASGGASGGGASGDAYDATSGAAVFDGRVVSGGATVATIQAKVAKAGKDGSAKVTATVVRADSSKKFSYKGTMGADGNATLECAGRADLELFFGPSEFSGSGGGEEISGARNLFSSKDKAEKSEAEAVLASVPKVLCAAWRTSAGRVCASISVAAKGKVKVSAVLPDGTKASAGAQLVIMEDGSWFAPVVNAKKTPFAFSIDGSGGGYSLAGLDGAVAGAPGTLAAGAKFAIDAGALSQLVGDDTFAAWLPDGVEVSQSGAKWIVAGGAKAGSLAYIAGTTQIDEKKAGANPSALKLTYAAKTGTFKGSFKAYRLSGGKPKAVTVQVNGVLTGSTACGSASVVKAGAVEVEIK